MLTFDKEYQAFDSFVLDLGLAHKFSQVLCGRLSDSSGAALTIHQVDARQRISPDASVFILRTLTTVSDNASTTTSRQLFLLLFDLTVDICEEIEPEQIKYQIDISRLGVLHYTNNVQRGSVKALVDKMSSRVPGMPVKEEQLRSRGGSLSLGLETFIGSLFPDHIAAVPY